METYKQIINDNDENKLRELLSKDMHSNIIYSPENCNRTITFNELLLIITIKIIKDNKINMMEILLYEYNFDLTFNNNSTLFSCCESGTQDMMKLLLNHSNISLSDSNNKKLQEIMNYLCDLGNTKLIKMLLEYGFDPNANDGEYLIIASDYDCADIVELLIEFGANVAHQDNRALYNAIVNTNYDMVVLLLQNGANMSAINRRLKNKQNDEKKKFINLLIENDIEFPLWVNYILK